MFIFSVRLLCIEAPHSSGFEVRGRKRLVAGLELPLTYKEHVLALEIGDRRQNGHRCKMPSVRARKL